MNSGTLEKRSGSKFKDVIARSKDKDEDQRPSRRIKVLSPYRTSFFLSGASGSMINLFKDEFGQKRMNQPA